jgi:micrococcal nuclease
MLCIDTPERSQPFYDEAKKALWKLIPLKSEVRIEAQGKDKYNRTLATVYRNGKNINLEMVKNGYALVYPTCRDNQQFVNAENFAKSKKLNYWSQSNPVTPWDFRHSK